MGSRHRLAVPSRASQLRRAISSRDTEPDQAVLFSSSNRQGMGNHGHSSLEASASLGYGGGGRGGTQLQDFGSRWANGKDLLWVLDAAKDILRLKSRILHNASIWTHYQRPTSEGFTNRDMADRCSGEIDGFRSNVAHRALARQAWRRRGATVEDLITAIAVRFSAIASDETTRAKLFSHLNAKTILAPVTLKITTQQQISVRVEH
ncbi:uncharacterized protein B0T15DRAFT_508622 [Chaetomium strumarium]|uniref:Uncharacterized protein n=1 Tax=Chaetomium strumarium TaxID=1170767 RepID=A0AAJ0M3Z4_9PEZI|nr:hypothetical protein B0T15DRAFT_508622 [Chaetomium strumarium]